MFIYNIFLYCSVVSSFLATGSVQDRFHTLKQKFSKPSIFSEIDIKKQSALRQKNKHSIESLLDADLSDTLHYDYQSKWWEKIGTTTKATRKTIKRMRPNVQTKTTLATKRRRRKQIKRSKDTSKRTKLNTGNESLRNYNVDNFKSNRRNQENSFYVLSKDDKGSVAIVANKTNVAIGNNTAGGNDKYSIQSNLIFNQDVSFDEFDYVVIGPDIMPTGGTGRTGTTLIIEIKNVKDLAESIKSVPDTDRILIRNDNLKKTSPKVEKKGIYRIEAPTVQNHFTTKQLNGVINPNKFVGRPQVGSVSKNVTNDNIFDKLMTKPYQLIPHQMTMTSFNPNNNNAQQNYYPNRGIPSNANQGVSYSNQRGPFYPNQVVASYPNRGPPFYTNEGRPFYPNQGIPPYPNPKGPFSNAIAPSYSNQRLPSYPNQGSPYSNQAGRSYFNQGGPSPPLSMVDPNQNLPPNSNQMGQSYFNQVGHSYANSGFPPFPNPGMPSNFNSGFLPKPNSGFSPNSNLRGPQYPKPGDFPYPNQAPSFPNQGLPPYPQTGPYPNQRLPSLPNQNIPPNPPGSYPNQEAPFPNQGLSNPKPGVISNLKEPKKLPFPFHNARPRRPGNILDTTKSRIYYPGYVKPDSPSLAMEKEYGPVQKPRDLQRQATPHEEEPIDLPLPNDLQNDMDEIAAVGQFMTFATTPLSMQHILEKATTTPTTRPPTKHIEQMFHEPIIKERDIDPFTKACLIEMRNQKTGFFSMFMEKLFESIALKNNTSVHRMLLGAEREADVLLRDDALMASWGEPFVSTLASFTQKLSIAEPDVIKSACTMLYRIMPHRHEGVTKDFNSVLDYADSLIEEHEGVAMLKVAGKIREYPNGDLNYIQLFEEIASVLLQPLRRLVGTTQRQILFESVNKLITNRLHPAYLEPENVTPIRRSNGDSILRANFTMRLKFAKIFKENLMREQEGKMAKKERNIAEDRNQVFGKGFKNYPTDNQRQVKKYLSNKKRFDILDDSPVTQADIPNMSITPKIPYELLLKPNIRQKENEIFTFVASKNKNTGKNTRPIEEEIKRPLNLPSNNIKKRIEVAPKLPIEKQITIGTKQTYKFTRKILKVRKVYPKISNKNTGFTNLPINARFSFETPKINPQVTDAFKFKDNIEKVTTADVPHTENNFKTTTVGETLEVTTGSALKRKKTGKRQKILVERPYSTPKLQISVESANSPDNNIKPTTVKMVTEEASRTLRPVMGMVNTETTKDGLILDKNYDESILDHKESKISKHINLYLLLKAIRHLKHKHPELYKKYKIHKKQGKRYGHKKYKIGSDAIRLHNRLKLYKDIKNNFNRLKKNKFLQSKLNKNRNEDNKFTAKERIQESLSNDEDHHSISSTTKKLRFSKIEQLPPKNALRMFPLPNDGPSMTPKEFNENYDYNYINMKSQWKDIITHINDNIGGDIGNITDLYEAFDYNNTSDEKDFDESAVLNIHAVSSYSDDEESLKFHLHDAMRHEDFKFEPSRRSNIKKISEKQLLRDPSSYSSEEIVLKSKIYKAYGFNNQYNGANFSDFVTPKDNKNVRMRSHIKRVNEESSYSNEELVLKDKLRLI